MKNHLQRSNYSLIPTISALDSYFSAAANGAAHRQRIALRTWHDLPPPERQALQQESQRLSLGDLGLSEAYTQAVLLLEYARQQAD